jgi:site-specific DNA recombinase
MSKTAGRDNPWAGMADQDIPWGAYARLSRKKPNRRRGQRQLGRYRSPDESVQRQMRLIREYAAERGLSLAEEQVYIENGRGAWRALGEAAPVRPKWDQMIAAGKAGEFGGLLTWKLDRFSRNVRDGEDLADLGVLLGGPESGRIDLRTAHGVSTFRKAVEAASHASSLASERVRAVFADMVASGYRVGGSGRLFGFEILSETELDYSEDTEDGGDDAGLGLTGPAAVIRENEAAIVRELARRLLDGETLRALAADLNERGITTTRGGQWHERNLSRMLGNPLYGGKLYYKGEFVTDLANVKPVLDEGTYDAVQDKLSTRRRGRRTTGRYPLSGILACGNPACGRRGTMAGYPRSRHGERAYICALAGGGCGQSILAEPVEAMVADEVARVSADTNAREAMRAARRYRDEQRDKLERKLKDLDDDMAESEIKRRRTDRGTRMRAEIDNTIANLTARREAAKRDLDALGETPAPQGSVPPLTAEEFRRNLPAAEQEVYIRELGGRITIVPSKRKPGSSRLPFDTARVSITWGS